MASKRKPRLAGDYPTVQAAEWVTPQRKHYFMGCCDCGLVHKLEFRLVPSWHGAGKKIQFRAWREEDQTKLLRKRNSDKARKGAR